MGFFKVKRFTKIAAAGRGEIAVRIIKTIQEMGMTSVLLHSSEDQNTLAFRLADETLCIGGGAPQSSYLNIHNIIEGIQSSGAQAVHPGAGFLSESADFAQACSENNIVFIGPSTEQLKLFGSKIQALQHVQSLGVPVLILSADESRIDSSQKRSYPLMIKADGGGGGIGIKKVDKEEDFLESLKSVQRISQSAFGSKRVFLEKYLNRCRHIEVQIFGDFSGRVYHLFERNCSVQKRNQKIIEETPSNLPQNLKDVLFKTACRIGESVNYQGAGTVEFLVQDNDFYFLEMNTRLQVEHPITEMLLGVDLVRAQILNAMKQAPFFNTSFQPRGHALECRIYSQDLETQRPLSGRLGALQWRTAPHSRLDMGYESYDVIPSFYDSLIGKAAAWDVCRSSCIEKMKWILKNSFVFGMSVNIPELLAVLSSDSFKNNQYDLQFLNQQLSSRPKFDLSKDEQEWIQECIKRYESGKNIQKEKFNPWFYHWQA